jgi:hypothetical protein
VLKAPGIGLIVVSLLVACAGRPGQPAAASSPTHDTGVQRYVALVHDFWSHYLASEQNAGDVCLRHVDLHVCAERGQAMIPVLQKFLTDLDTTPVPANFAADDANFRRQLPSAISHLKGAVEAALANNEATFTQDINAYVGDMVPVVTDSLDHVDPTVVHV